MSKQFKLESSQIRPLVYGYGSCIASDHITVEGKPVGYMYREASDNGADSGWRFFSGMESQAYADNPDNFSIYDVNTIANYDPSVIPLLDAAPGSAWGKDASGQFVEEATPIDPDA